MADGLASLATDANLAGFRNLDLLAIPSRVVADGPWPSLTVNGVQDYIKIFLVSLATSVAVLFLLGPVMMKLNPPAGPRPQAEGAAQPSETTSPPPATPELTAPNLQGLALREARDRWRAQGIVIIEDSQRVDSSVEPGTILSQIPSGGAPLQTKEIRVVVAAAPEMVTVPSVVGKSAVEATEVLVAAGFEVPAPDKEPGAGEPGSVLRQEPNAGSKSEKGALVRLVVAGEPEADATAGTAEPSDTASPPAGTVEVPKVTGMFISGARSKIKKAGLTVGEVRERQDPEMAGNRVLSQSPSAGSEVAPGTAVDLVIVQPD